MAFIAEKKKKKKNSHRNITMKKNYERKCRTKLGEKTESRKKNKNTYKKGRQTEELNEEVKTGDYDR